jgi:hypothetical protein
MRLGAQQATRSLCTYPTVSGDELYLVRLPRCNEVEGSYVAPDINCFSIVRVCDRAFNHCTASVMSRLSALGIQTGITTNLDFASFPFSAYRALAWCPGLACIGRTPSAPPAIIILLGPKK